MPRGPYYTKDVDDGLTKLMDDMRRNDPKCTYMDIAQKAIEYGICKRKASAIAQHLSILDGHKKEVSKDEDAESEQMDAEDLIVHHKAELYDSIRDTFFKTATLGESNGKVFLNINIPMIRSWFKDNEPERFSSCLEELKEEKAGAR